MTEAQTEALKLLKLVDKICGEKQLQYTLGDRALLNCVYQQREEYFDPNSITVCLRYEEYRKLLNYLEQHSESFGIEILTYQNKENFDSMSAWLIPGGKNLLPPGREKDECYYRTRLVLTPVFSAGNSLRECRETCQRVERAFRLIDSRSPLPDEWVLSSLHDKKKCLLQGYYSKKQKKNRETVSSVFERLVILPADSRYMMFLNQNHTAAWLPASEFVTERMMFFDAEVSVLKNWIAFIKRNNPLDAKNGMNKVSELRLRGGRDLRRIQLIQLDMLKEIDRICRKHHLKYNIAFGTLLGAVRHGGFVPWDDDADINMPYEDYLKLIEVIDEEIDSKKYYFRYQDKEDDCNITYAHLKRNGTVYTKRGRDGFRYHPGVFIDIVPLFYGAPNRLFHIIQTKICRIFRTACWAYVGAESEKNPRKRAYYRQLAQMGNKKAYRRFLKAATFFRHRSGKMLFLNGLDRSPYNIGFVKRECFDEPIEIEFEGYMFLAPGDITGVLSYCYGKDYLRYLPLFQRVPKNDALIELGKLYEEI